MRESRKLRVLNPRISRIAVSHQIRDLRGIFNNNVARQSTPSVAQEDGFTTIPTIRANNEDNESLIKMGTVEQFFS